MVLAVMQYLVTFLFVVLVHECGHMVAALLLQIPLKRIGLTRKGVFLQREKSPHPWQELVIAAAGPSANLLAALLPFANPLWAQFNIVLGFSNLFPIQGSDGWRIRNTLRVMGLISSRLHGLREKVA
jgi:Zn-dependent protease